MTETIHGFDVTIRKIVPTEKAVQGGQAKAGTVFFCAATRCACGINLFIIPKSVRDTENEAWEYARKWDGKISKPRFSFPCECFPLEDSD